MVADVDEGRVMDNNTYVFGVSRLKDDGLGYYFVPTDGWTVLSGVHVICKYKM